jgi:hypothetical protein
MKSPSATPPTDTKAETETSRDLVPEDMIPSKAGTWWVKSIMLVLGGAVLLLICGMAAFYLAVFRTLTGADCVDNDGANAACQATVARARPQGYWMVCAFGSYGEHAHGGGCPQHQGFSFQLDSGARTEIAGRVSVSAGNGPVDCFDPEQKLGLVFDRRDENLTTERRTLAAAACRALSSH